MTFLDFSPRATGSQNKLIDHALPLFRKANSAKFLLRETERFQSVRHLRREHKTGARPSTQTPQPLTLVFREIFPFNLVHVSPLSESCRQYRRGWGGTSPLETVRYQRLSG